MSASLKVCVGQIKIGRTEAEYDAAHWQRAVLLLKDGEYLSATFTDGTIARAEEVAEFEELDCEGCFHTEI